MDAPQYIEFCPNCIISGMVNFGVQAITCQRCDGTGMRVDWTKVEEELEGLEENST